MPELNAENMAAKLSAGSFKHTGPAVAALSDPIADTPMMVMLDQLKPYDLNPRITHNPLYEEIKASIRARGLDAPPPVTRRPTETHYIIRNGGNTRLQILNELWAETKDERFYCIPTLFRPWPARGELVLLTGHLAENELHGSLSFIERALGVEKARELYEQESQKSLTQTELARRLTADGYPITQSHISRMQDAVRYLLPAIPQILYAGLGKPQIERLASLRKNASRAWEQHAARAHPTVEFPTLFQDVLASFDVEPASFSVQRAQDELLGQMAAALATDYDTLALEVADSETRHWMLSQDASAAPPTKSPSIEHSSQHPPLPLPPGPAPTAAPAQPVPAAAMSRTPSDRAQANATPASTGTQTREKPSTPSDEDRIAQHIVSPVQTTERLQSIQRSIADATGDPIPDFRATVIQAIPVQAGGLHPISDIWYIEDSLDVIDRLQVHIAQLAREIADEASMADCIEATHEGLGFSVRPKLPSHSATPFLSRAVLRLLSVLSAPYLTGPLRRNPDGLRLADDVAPLLLGVPPDDSMKEPPTRLSDVAIVKLFRLTRLARRLLDLQSAGADPVT